MATKGGVVGTGWSDKTRGILAELLDCVELIERTEAMIPDDHWAAESLHQHFHSLSVGFARAAMRDEKRKTQPKQ